MNINDTKAVVLTTEGFDFEGATVDDMERAWLNASIVAPTEGREQIQDLWMFYLFELGFVQPDLTSRKVAFFKANGALGVHYSDIELSYWKIRGGL